MAERIPWHPSPHGGPLGRNLQHDPRSWAYRVTRTAPVIQSVTHYRVVQPYDQGDVGDCVPNAGKGTLSTHPFGHRFTSERIIRTVDYPALTAMDDIPGYYKPGDPNSQDTGSDGLSFAKYAVRKGWIKGPYRHAMGIDDAVDALMGQPLLTGVDWFESMDTPDDHGQVTLAGQVRGGHEFSVVGYRRRGTVADYTEDLVYCVNSWGVTWSRRGRFFLRVCDWATLLDRQGDVTVLRG